MGLNTTEEYFEAVDKVCMGCAYGEDYCEFCAVRKTVDIMKDAAEKAKTKPVKPENKKYVVHFGVRLTSDYYIAAPTEEQAIAKAREYWESEQYSDMEYADDDVDSWEDKTLDDNDMDYIF